MTLKRKRLERDLHIRVDENLQQLISQIAQENNLKDSTFVRIVLQRNVPNYSRNRFFGA